MHYNEDNKGTIQEELESIQARKFDESMAAHTLVGNLTHWRKNFRSNEKRLKILAGRAKIFALLNRFKV